VTAEFFAYKPMLLLLCCVTLPACTHVAQQLAGPTPDRDTQHSPRAPHAPAAKFPSPEHASQKIKEQSLNADEQSALSDWSEISTRRSNNRPNSEGDPYSTPSNNTLGDSTNILRQVQHLRPLNSSEVDDEGPELNEAPTPEMLPAPAGPTSSIAPGEESYPIDLATALALAGGNNLQIAFAAERVQAAMARVDKADVLWVPSLSGGLIYNNHAGRIQATEGRVVEASRNSLFVGAGAGIGSAPTTGGSGGPARMFVDLPLVDVLFEPLAQRQALQAAKAQQAVAFNNTLLQVTSAYLDLLRAEFQVAIAQEAVDNAAQLVKVTEDFSRAGEGLEADAQRAKAELDGRRRALLKTEEVVAVNSAELARLLRLDPAVTLHPTDQQPVAIDLVPVDMSLHDLIGQALANRPEAVGFDALVEETRLRVRQEHLRPWLPHLYAGFSGGGFGGAPGGSIKNFSDRTDFDIAAIWQLENFGLGNDARRREQDSAHLQAHIVADQVRDQIASEVSRSYHQIQSRRQQIEAVRSQVKAARRSLELSLDGIRDKVLRPIETQQAISALATARRQYAETIIDFNQAQFELLRAIGQPPHQNAATSTE
jgi:outer membrane protein TolC